MITLDELIGILKDLRKKAGKDSPVRVSIPRNGLHHHHSVLQVEMVQYDEEGDVHMILQRCSLESVADETM